MINKSMFKKIIFSFLLATLLLTSVFVPFAKAEEGNGTWYNPSFTEWSVKVFDDSNPNEIFGERYTYAQVVWILHSLQAFPIQGDILTCVNASSTGDLGEIGECIEGILEKNRGASLGPIMSIAAVTDSVLSTQPASGIEYLADTAKRLKIIPEAYAQGVGFEGLQPALKAWKVTRNMAYALSIIAIVILSFMIMFRVKISPQVVITVQSALPKIVFALIFITFSYAIAGLVIDLSYLILGLIAALTKSVGVEITTLSITDFFTKLVFSSSLFWSLLLTLVSFLAFWGMLGLTAATVTSAAIPALNVSAAGLGVGFLLGGILFLVLIIMMVWASIKILFLLVKTFINILLLIIAAPIMILFGTFTPAIGFGSWLRSLAANIIVFPAVKLMLFLSHYFYWSLASTDANVLAGSSYFNPLKIIPSGGEVATLPGFLPFDLGSGLLGWIIAFGILFLTPKVGDMIKAMTEGKPFSYGAALGEAATPFRTGAAYGAGVFEKKAELAGDTAARKGLYRALQGILSNVARGGRG
jgi:hypothetical protein